MGMDREQFVKKIKSGGYASETYAQRAIGRSAMSKSDKKMLRDVTVAYFQNPSKPAPKADRSLAREKIKRGRKFDVHYGINGLGVDGDGDCLAVTMAEVAFDKSSRDKFNRLLSQAREEPGMTLPVLSNRFARLCKLFAG